MTATRSFRSFQLLLNKRYIFRMNFFFLFRSKRERTGALSEEIASGSDEFVQRRSI